MIGERARYWILVSGTLLMLGLFSWGAWLAAHQTGYLSSRASARNSKVFKRTLVEGLSVTRHGTFGVEFVKCGACRMEKRKSGVLTFGGMNVLVIEDLDVVIPPQDPCESDASADSHDHDDSRALVRRMGISDGFLSERGVPFKFSSVRIARLNVSRLEGSNEVVRVFSAKSAESNRDGMALEGCRVAQQGGDDEIVRRARLRLLGRMLRLEWDNGHVDML